MSPLWPDHFQPDVVREAYGEKLSSYVLALEAWRRGLTVTVNHPRMHSFSIRGTSGQQMKFIQSRPSQSSHVAHRTAKNKHRSNQLLEAAGVPVPQSVLINPKKVSVRDLIQHAERIGYPVVLKPRNGAMGVGVFANIEESSVLRKRYAELVQHSRSNRLVLEKHILGNDYRVLVFGNHYLAACERVPANVTGDGLSSVDALISRKNRNRRGNPFLSKGLIKKDQEVSDYLSQHGYDYASIPAKGEYLRLRSAANASAGGDVVDVTDQLPQYVRESAVRAASAIPDLAIAGVDILYEGPEAAPSGEHVVLELNSQPQIGVNMYPTHGTGVDVPKKIIDICFPGSKRPENDGGTQLGLRLRPALRPLASGHAAEITFPALPAHGLPVRNIYEVANPTSLSPKQVTRILRQSERNAVAGYLRCRSGNLQLMVAGEQQNSDDFVDSVSAITGIQFTESQTWTGIIHLGFEIDI